MAGPSLAHVVALAAVALVAGTVDAMAGGGGLLTVPALLAAGLPPHLALGTNKGQSVFGSGAAMARFTWHGWLSRKDAWFLPLGFCGALLGATLLLQIRPEPLRPVILGLLLAAGAFVAFRRTGVERRVRYGALLASGGSFAIGIYDGFFGPGTGTFLIVLYVATVGLPLAMASARAKVVNFGSNLAALALFAAHHTVIWRVALPMAAAQLAGGSLGAHLTIRGGDRWVRRAVLVVVAALVLKLARDL